MIRIIPALACLALFAGAAIGADEPLLDSDGNRFEQATPVRRVVSLAPHITELFFAAGAGSSLVGVVEYSDYPASAQNLPRVGDAFRVDLEALALLEPDLVATWQSGTPKALQEKLRALGYPVFSFEVHNLDDVAESLHKVGRLAGTDDIAGQVADEYRRELQILQRRYAGRTPLSVFYQVSERPLYTVNGEHFISKILETCGGRNVFADVSVLAPVVALEAVVTRNPQVIIVGRYPTMDTDPLRSWGRFPGLDAVANENLYQVDAETVARSTPRILAGIREVCTALDSARAKLTVAR